MEKDIEATALFIVWGFGFRVRVPSKGIARKWAIKSTRTRRCEAVYDC